MTRYGVIEWKSSNTACVCVLWCYSDDHNWTIEKEWLCLCAMYTVVLLFMQVAVTQMALPLSFTWAVVCLVQHLPVEFMKIACGFECTLERFTIANWHTVIHDTVKNSVQFSECTMILSHYSSPTLPSSFHLCDDHVCWYLRSRSKLLS